MLIHSMIEMGITPDTFTNVAVKNIEIIDVKKIVALKGYL